MVIAEVGHFHGVAEIEVLESPSVQEFCAFGSAVQCCLRKLYHSSSGGWPAIGAGACSEISITGTLVTAKYPCW